MAIGVDSFFFSHRGNTRILQNAESCMSTLCHKTELNAKTQQRFTPLTTPEKQHICLASASRRQDKK